MAILNVKNVPDPLYKKLRARARQERRSIAQTVIQILSQSLETQEPLSILDLKGLGKELWSELDPKRHVESERGSWE
ncbi:MAG: hypothetical protein HY720_27580 [Planctomycetes bacterium]|nr:hypothetical protein [Planctomycetota bacterium]